MREFVASVRGENGTQAVTVEASAVEHAIKKLQRLGYTRIFWIL